MSAIGTDRKWVAVCTNKRGRRVLLRFLLPESEKWNHVDGEGPNGECLFKDVVEDAEDYALCHVTAGKSFLVFETVFHGGNMGEDAWSALRELKPGYILKK